MHADVLPEATLLRRHAGDLRREIRALGAPRGPPAVRPHRLPAVARVAVKINVHAVVGQAADHRRAGRRRGRRVALQERPGHRRERRTHFAAQHVLGGAVGFALGAIAVRRDRDRAARRGAALLHRVRELVGEQAAARVGAGRVRATRERDVRAGRVRRGADRARRAIGAIVVVDADAAQIVAEARLEEAPGRGIERLRGTCQHVVDDRRCRCRPGSGHHGGSGGVHHCIGDPIGFMLQPIIGATDRELGLGAEHTLVAQAALERAGAFDRGMSPGPRLESRRGASRRSWRRPVDTVDQPPAHTMSLAAVTLHRPQRSRPETPDDMRVCARLDEDDNNEGGRTAEAATVGEGS